MQPNPTTSTWTLLVTHTNRQRLANGGLQSTTTLVRVAADNDTQAHLMAAQMVGARIGDGMVLGTSIQAMVA